MSENLETPTAVDRSPPNSSSGGLVAEICVCALLVAAIHLMVNALFPIHFETNDDVLMAMMSYGCGLTSAPDAHLLHMHFFIGQLLCGLNTVAPGVPWYTAWLMGVQFASLTVIVFLLRDSFNKSTGTLVFLATCCVYAITFISKIQFTMVATTSALAAMLVLLSATDDSVQSKLNVSSAQKLVLAIFFLTLSSLIRADALVLTSMLGGTWIALKHGIQVFRQPAPRNALIALSTGVAISLALSQLNGLYYKTSPKWANFYEVNAEIGKFYYGWIRYTPSTQPAFREVGWSENDFDMINLRNVGDRNIFGIEKIRLLAEKAGSKHRKPLSPKIIANDLMSVITDPLCRPAIIVIALGFLFLENAARRIRLVILTLGALGVMTVLLSVMHLPPRVYLSILATIGSIAIFELSAPLVRRPRKVSYVALCSIIVLFFALIFPSLREEGMSFLKRYDDFNDVLRELDPKPEQKYIAWIVFPYESLSPFDDLKSKLINMKHLSISQYAWTPIYDERLREFQLNDLLQSANRDDVLWISNPRLNAVFSKYAYEHYNRKIGFDRVFQHRSNFEVYKAKLFSTSLK